MVEQVCLSKLTAQINFIFSYSQCLMEINNITRRFAPYPRILQREYDIRFYSHLFYNPLKANEVKQHSINALGMAHMIFHIVDSWIWHPLSYKNKPFMFTSKVLQRFKELLIYSQCTCFIRNSGQNTNYHYITFYSRPKVSIPEYSFSSALLKTDIYGKFKAVMPSL